MFKRTFSLTELVLVLVIISISLGLAITNYSNVLERATLTTTQDVLTTLTTLFIDYEGITGELPNNLDRITDLGTLLRTQMIADLAVSDMATIIAQLEDGGTNGPFTETDVLSAFTAKGIDSLANHDAGNDATFGFDFGDSFDLTATPPTGLTLAGVVAPVLQDVFNKVQVGGEFYFLLGVGNRASWINSSPGLQSSPVYQTEVANHAEANVASFYSRFLVLLKLTASGSTIDLEFVACTYPHPVDGLGNSDEIIEKLNNL